MSEKLTRAERVEKIIEETLAAISGPGKNPNSSVGPFYSNRAMRRGGSGQPRSRIFSEKMRIPRKR